MTRRFSVYCEGEFISDDPVQHQLARNQIRAFLEHVPGTAIGGIEIEDIVLYEPDEDWAVERGSDAG